MSYIQRPLEAGQASPKGGPRNLTTTARKNVRSAIPIPRGTVALRVNHLQSLSKATATQTIPLNLGSRPKHASRKVQHNPFASIFWRKVVPGNDHKLPTNSISSSTISPTNCEGAQSSYFPDKETSYEDEGYTPTTLGDTTSEVCEGYSSTHTPVCEAQILRDLNRVQNGQRLDGPQEEKELRERLRSHLRGRPVPSSNLQSSRKSKPVRPEIFRSDNSVATTSTMRRQSVRDLFEDRGIKRPAGLASPRHSFQENNDKYHPSKAHVSCHLCSFKNEYVQIDCRNCGHHFCSNCPASSIYSHNHTPHSSMNSRSSNRYTGRMDAPVSLYSSPHVSKKHRVMRPDRNPGLRRRNRYDHVQEPDLTAGDSSSEWTGSMPESRPSKDKRGNLNNGQHHKAPRKVVRDVSDLTIKNKHSLPDQSTVNSSAKRHPGATWRPSREPQSAPNHPSKVSHHGQSMPQTIDHYYKEASMPAPENPQSGFRVNANLQSPTHTSKFDDARVQDRRASPYYSKLDSRVRREIKSESYFQNSRPSSGAQHQVVSTSNNNEVPEYIECHGYPRTGHDRCGSPVESGIIGECQHCLDDCDCLACQSTHHAVRCCTHKDHPSISHFHRLPRTATRTGHHRSLSAISGKKITIPPPVITSLQAGQLEGQSSPRGLEFKYPVEYIEHVKSKPKKRLISFGDSLTGTHTNAVPDLKQDTNRRGSFPLTFEQFIPVDVSRHATNGTSSALQLRGMLPLINGNTPQSQISPSTTTGTIVRGPVHERLNSQDEPRNQKTEKLKVMVQEQSDKKMDPTNKKVAKAERKILKHLAKLEKEEGKLKGHEEDIVSDERTLLLDYEMGLKPRRVPRHPSPLSSRAVRADQKTHNRALHHHHRTGSAATNSTSKDRHDQVDFVKIGNRAHLETKTKAAGIRGITVIVHMSNDEDMVFRLDASMAESARV